MDGERGEAILHELDGVLDRLAGHAREVDFVRFSSDSLYFDAILRAMTLAGQCAIDLALMIVAERRLGAPPTYKEAFLALARAKVIPAEMNEPLAEWASIRNLIVHLYTKLDLEKLHLAYTTKLAVLRKFRGLAAAALGSAAPPAPPAGSSVREPPSTSSGQARVRYRKTAAKPVRSGPVRKRTT